MSVSLNFMYGFVSSVEDALAHPYLSSLHDICDEPICHSPFVFDFDEDNLTLKELRTLIYKEAVQFHPHLPHNQ